MQLQLQESSLGREFNSPRKMCIIFFIVSDGAIPLSSPGYKLILASNRDEVYSRPAQAVSMWAEAEHVIAGEKMQRRQLVHAQ